MSSTRAALLRAVGEAPERDEPRLAFAGWLKGRRDRADRARGEFIEVQLAWARRGIGPAEQLRLRLRDRQLLQDFQHEWLKDVPEGLRSVTFKRGFIEDLSASAQSFVEGARALFAREVVQELLLWSEGPRGAAQIGECPELTQVRRLTFSDFAGDHDDHLGSLGVSALAASPFLSRIEALDIDWAEASEAAMGALVCSPHLGNLKVLKAAQSGLAGRAVEALTKSRLPRQLKTLHTGYDALGAEGVRQLLQVRWPRLADLGLSQSQLETTELCQLLDAPTIPRLRCLSVNGSAVGVAGARRLARAAGLGRLRELSMARCGLSDVGVAALVSWGAVDRLRWMYLGENELGPRGARALAGPRLGALRGINLDDNQLGPQGAMALAAATFFPRLTELSLEGNGIGTQGLSAMLERLRGDRLRILALDGNALDDEAGRHLLRWRGLGFLELLMTEEGNHFSTALAQRLHAASLSRLTEV